MLLFGFLVFLFIVGAGGVAARSWIMDATQPRTATLELVAGQSLLIRSSPSEDWRLVSNPVTVQEGDMISTGSATAGWLTLFDQGTVEIAENTIVHVRQMRTSRMFRDRKEIGLEPIRGTIYVGMAPRGEFSTSVLRVDSGPVTVRMRDEIRTQQTGSFLVEAQRQTPTGDESDPLLAVRVAVLRGEAELITHHGQQVLRPDQQVVVDARGMFGDVTAAVREHIRNGNFSRQLADWLEYHEPPTAGSTVPATIERIPVGTDDGREIALQIARPSGQSDSWEAGVQQPIGQSLRLRSSLNLSLRFRIDEQQPVGGGVEMTEFPLIVLINYVDVQGQGRTWWHGFYVFEDLDNPVPEERATLVEREVWKDVAFDLRNLSPLPRRLSSVSLYSSGHAYKALVSDISLTSSEAGDAEYD
jgi:hypothetical protein